MIHTLEEVIESAQTLDRESQYRLAERLMLDLAEATEYSDSWVREINRRVEESADGTVEMVSRADVTARVRKLIAA